MNTGRKNLIDKLTAGINSVSILAAVPEAPSRGHGEKVLAVCNDHIKRVFSFHHQLKADLEPLQTEGARIEKELKKAVFGLRPGDAAELFTQMAGLATPERQAQAARLKEIRAQLRGPARFASWVGDYFWAEVKNTFPALDDYPELMLCSDWSIVENTSRDEQGEGSLFEKLFRRAHEAA